MYGILVKIAVFQFKLFPNNGTKFGAPGNRTPLCIMEKKENEKNKKRPLWHYPILFIVGIVSLFAGMMLVRFIFSLFY